MSTPTPKPTHLWELLETRALPPEHAQFPKETEMERRLWPGVRRAPLCAPEKSEMTTDLGRELCGLAFLPAKDTA